MERYQKRAKDYLDGQKEFLGLHQLSHDDYNHVCQLAASVMMTRDEFLPGGGFVQAVVDNDLEGAIARGDSAAIIGLKALVMVKLWCHLK